MGHRWHGNLDGARLHKRGFAPIRHDDHGSSLANGTLLDNLGCRERYELPEAVVFGG
jgi:hypothetical protein